MPRANRFFLAGYVWHLTHRCHDRQFLLRFARDRRRWLAWLYEARRRYGLCVLNYIVTSNHVHLLVRDRGRGEIAASIRLVAGRVAQEYNRRKGRSGAFWEGRYHATAVQTGAHLANCLTYIDLNMVRAGAVRHPAQWDCTGYREIQNPPDRYRIIDQAELLRVLEITSPDELRRRHAASVERALATEQLRREAQWSESIAVGTRAFVSRIQSELGPRALHRSVTEAEGKCCLQEGSAPYDFDFPR